MNRFHPATVVFLAALTLGCGTVRVAQVRPTRAVDIRDVPLIPAKEAQEKWTAKGFTKFIGFQGSFVSAEALLNDLEVLKAETEEYAARKGIGPGKKVDLLKGLLREHESFLTFRLSVTSTNRPFFKLSTWKIYLEDDKGNRHDPVEIVEGDYRETRDSEISRDLARFSARIAKVISPSMIAPTSAREFRVRAMLYFPKQDLGQWASAKLILEPPKKKEKRIVLLWQFEEKP